MYTEEQIQALAPKESTFKAGKKLSAASNWDMLHRSKRAIWGSIKGSGKKPYLVQVDTSNLAYKCTCPSRQFPCKHAIGLLLVLVQEKSAFTALGEPDYVEDWIDKRSKRAEKVDKEEKELTKEEQAKRNTSKLKRQDDKLKLTLAGVSELKLWLTDMIRVGIIELPTYPAAYFDSMIERMIDAKAPGLAGWVKALRNLPYEEQHQWQDQSLEIISKLFLLIKAVEHLDTYNLSEQNGIKSLLGWTFTQKELMADKANISIKDQWLVLGSHKEAQDDLTIFRYWLYGLNNQKNALIIRFQNKFTNTETIPLINATVLEAELTFYPGLEPHRAFIKKQKEVTQYLSQKPKGTETWHKFQEEQLKSLRKNPWLNNDSGIIENLTILKNGHEIIAVDRNKQYQILSKELDEDKTSTLLLNALDKPITLAFAQRNNSILPLGIFLDNTYSTL